MVDFLIIGSAAVSRNLSDPQQAQGLPETGSEAITSESGGIGETNHPDPSALGLDGTAWVSLAMAFFIAILLFKKVPALIAATLDRQIAEIRRQLDDAKTLRAEAEALRDEYAHKVAGAEGETAAMLAQADREVTDIVRKAKADSATLIARRKKMADDRIAAAEHAAIADIRAKAADAAARAAATLLAARLDANADRALVDRTIMGLGRPN